MNIIITMFLILILLNQTLVLIKLFGLHFTINFNFGKNKTEAVEVLDEEQADILSKQSMYNVERFKKRMEKMRAEQNADDDGLFDIEYIPTPEDLGYFTGSEISE